MVIAKLQQYFYSNLQGYIATKILLGWYKATIVIMDYKKASSSSSLIDGSSEGRSRGRSFSRTHISNYQNCNITIYTHTYMVTV